MPAPTAAELILVWDPDERGAPHRRLSALLAALDGDDASRSETLGERNRRLLALHRALVGAPLEARVSCARCAVDNEFTIPAGEILDAPAPAPGARVQVRSRGAILSFRLPRMSDIEPPDGASAPDEVRQKVLQQCLVEGPADAITNGLAAEVGEQFEAQDPAANIVVRIQCAGCGASLAVSVDLASFVARDLDRMVNALYRDVDVIASAYGWAEMAILALPAERRRRYVTLVASRPRAYAGAGRKAR